LQIVATRGVTRRVGCLCSRGLEAFKGAKQRDDFRDIPASDLPKSYRISFYQAAGY
jgi:hypothetical protein